MVTSGVCHPALKACSMLMAVPWVPVFFQVRIESLLIPVEVKLLDMNDRRLTLPPLPKSENVYVSFVPVDMLWPTVSKNLNSETLAPVATWSRVTLVSLAQLVNMPVNSRLPAVKLCEMLTLYRYGQLLNN